MFIIKLDAIDSTNSYLKELAREKNLDDFTVVLAEHQTKGRGQRGSTWYSNRGKNLTFSMLKTFDRFNTDQQFYISMAVSLAISSLLQELGISSFVKWPNDILADEAKIAGVLIENTIKGNTIVQSVIGIGLNVNQQKFDTIGNRITSLYNCLGESCKLDEIFEKLMAQLKHYMNKLEIGHNDEILNAYLKAMYRFKKPTSFKTKTDGLIKGMIIGIDKGGQLIIQLNSGQHRSYMMKEISFSDW
jgi:BirA family biotin operon repressor/biotin-[acetyl-CoA-carboxylase] ligase